MLTIFTPTYNRDQLLTRLYESLERQTNKCFEWLIVDDGSTDETEKLISRFILKSSFPIRYYSQANGGKHRAVNRGVKEANGDLFFIVDSDDYLFEDTVAWIYSAVDEIKDNTEFAGISGLKVYENGRAVIGDHDFGTIDADALEIRVKYNITGDLAEIYKTDILRSFPFPEIEGEKFCAEGLIWNRIAMKGYKLRYFCHPIYICEYLEGGLTNTNIKGRMNSPECTMMLYREALDYPGLPLKNKIKNGIFYWRFSKNSKKSLIKKLKGINIIYWPLILPGILLRWIKG